MPNKHTKMFRPWYEDNVLSQWEKVKTGDKSYTYEKVKHVRSHKDDRLGRQWEHERIWNDQASPRTHG